MRDGGVTITVPLVGSSLYLTSSDSQYDSATEFHCIVPEVVECKREETVNMLFVNYNHARLPNPCGFASVLRRRALSSGGRSLRSTDRRSISLRGSYVKRHLTFRGCLTFNGTVQAVRSMSR